MKANPTVWVAIRSAAATPVFAASCEGVAALALPHAKITLAQVVSAGAFSPPGGGQRGGKAGAARPYQSLPEFCRVAATLTPTSDSDIKAEVWLPLAGWNRKFQAVGNGGWAGTISYSSRAEALKMGYATASTDTGHSTKGGAFVLGHRGKLIDFAWRSEHEMTVKGKAIVQAFYGSAAPRSYWNGFSTGMGHCSGGEAPNVFDKIGTLDRWVEEAQAPGSITASHSSEGKVDRTRRLCPYPRVAKYKGSGSVDEAANFACELP